MFLRCFRVDRIFRAINEYIVDTMDEFYITPPVISFANIYEQTNCNMPVCFILSAGSDPTNDLMKLADLVGVGMGNFCHISLGQGQEKVSRLASTRKKLSPCAHVRVRVCVLLLLQLFTSMPRQWSKQRQRRK